MYPVPPAREGRRVGAGRTGCSPSPSDPLLISPWEGEGDGSRERGFNCDVKDGGGSAGMTERGWLKENAPVSPRGRFPILSYVL